MMTYSRFLRWWRAVNLWLAQAGAAEALFGDARAHFELGESARRAAAEILVLRAER